MYAGERIKIIRKKQGMTQKELAQKTNRSQQVVAMIENSKSTPRRSTLEPYAKALDVPVELLFNPDELSQEDRESFFFNYGLDEKFYHTEDPTAFSNSDPADPTLEIVLLSKFRQLNQDARLKVILYASDLCEIDRYKK